MKVKSLFDKLEKLILFLLSALFAVMVISIFLQIVLRYVFHSANPWAEELTRYSFVWLTMLGASVASRKRRHMNVDFFTNMMPKIALKINNVIASILTLSLFLVMIIYGANLASITHKQLSAALSMPMSYAYLAIPVGGFLMLLFTVESYFVKNINEAVKED